LRARAEAIAGQARMLEERWSAMQSMEALIRERDEAISGQARMLEERWSAMQSMEAMIRERDEAIAGQARMRAAFLDLATAQPLRFRVVDGAADAAEVGMRVRRALGPL
ncbi:MAG: hypothetical protein ACK414_14525, partial [Gemmobacter sp.]